MSSESMSNHTQKTPAWDVEVDAMRLLCPMPVIRLQDSIKNQAAGARVKIICSDPGTMSDIPTWCRINGHTVLSIEELEYEFIFIVEKSTSE